MTSTETADAGRRVPYVDLAAQFAEERADLLACMEDVLASGQLVGGAVIERLEEALARHCEVAHAVAVNSGTDALILAMKALGIGAGDEVITPPNSFIASTSAIVAVSATPVFADVQDDQNMDPAAVADAVTPRTRAVMPVHLTGRMADMDAICAIAQRHGLAVIEDAAQAFGARYHGRASGSIGHVGCFSAHPLKNFNATGDAGFVTTSDDAVARRIRLLRNHGLADRDTSLVWGTVSRMDCLQAAVLLMRLDRTKPIVERRRANAARYRERLDGGTVFAPPCREHEFNTFHTFVIQADRRDALQRQLAARDVETAVHYPIPIHLQPAALDLGYRRGSFPVTERQAERILTLPVHQFLSGDDIDYVAGTIAGFYP